jgi:hypothetical protein
MWLECGLNVVVCGPYDEAVEGLDLGPMLPSPQNGVGCCRGGFAILVPPCFAREGIRIRAGKMQSLSTHLQPLHQDIFLVCNHSFDDLCNRNNLPSYAGIVLQVAFLHILSLFFGHCLIISCHVL